MAPDSRHQDDPLTGHVDARDKRRARFRHATFTNMPNRLTGGMLARARSIARFHHVERTIALPDLPDALDGLRIVHISDLHIGELMTAHSLPRIVQAVNKLAPDLVAVTGDLIDLSLDSLDAVIAAMGELVAPLGAFLVPGNHDYLDDGPQFIRRVRASGLRLLINQAQLLEHHGCPITVAGIDYASKPEPLAKLVHQTMHAASHRHRHALTAAAAANPTAAGARNGFRLLLSHHPHAFDQAVSEGVDLTLSGHTHGGQLNLAHANGKRGSIGLGSLSFKYPQGLYRRGDSYLYVTSGVGDWFPLRIRCPAEIATLVLRAEPEPAEAHGLSHP